MQRRRKLLLSIMVGGLVLFYGITVATALTPQEIAEKARAATVFLEMYDKDGKPLSRGSGFFLQRDLIATNYHVIQGATHGTAKLADKDLTYSIEDITKTDKKNDLALLKIKPNMLTILAGISPLPLGNSDTVKVMDTIYVAGNPLGFEGTVVPGSISAIRPEGWPPLVQGKLLQMTAPISKGSSGGPVLNDRGEVIGISTLAVSVVMPDLTVPQNLNFAIAVNHLKALMPTPPMPVKPKSVAPKVTPPSVQPKPAKPQADPPPVEPKSALTTREIAEIALDSTVHLGLIDGKGNSWTGSGFVIHDDQIATNYHVIDNMSIGGVKLVGKKDIYPVEAILDSDKDHDLAIIKVEGIDAPVLSLGDSDTVQIGDKVYVAGNPQGLEGSFSDGIISGIRGDPDKFFQMTAPISQGSSGGPVFNERGEVIGVSFATSRNGQNLNFAIPVNYLKALMPTLPPPVTRPTVKHDSPSKISVGETVPLTLDLISSKAPQQVTIYYTTYDRNRNELEQSNQRMRLGGQQSASSTWDYKVDLPSQNHVGSIEYYIAVKYDNHLSFRYPRARPHHYQIPIVDGKPPTISLLDPPDGATFGPNQEITFRAKVTDNIAVKDVHIDISSRFNDPQSYKLTAKGSSDIYTIDITLANIITLQYYLTATDEEGNESRSEYRQLEIRITSEVNLEKGIKSYEQARYKEAINALSLAIPALEDPKERAEACLYLGGSKRGSGEGNDKVREQFQRAIRHNPDQELPPRLGKDHPVFAELIEEVRRELTGELTVISLLPHTEIWIDGNEVDRKMLGTGTVNRRLLTGNYIVEGIDAEKSQRVTIRIESDRHKVVNLGIPPTVEHDPPPRISVGERVSLTLDLISAQSPKQVKIYYKTYYRDNNELEQSNQEMRLWAQQSAPSTWIYKVDLPPQKRVGSIAYYIEIGYENHGLFRHPSDQNDHHQISIVGEEPSTVSPPDPPNVGRENESKPESSGIRTPTEGEGDENKSEPEKVPQGEPPDDPPSPPSAIYQGIWASVSADGASTFAGDGSYMFRLAYLREGKTHPTLGAQLDFSPDRTNMSAMFQWGPRPPGKSKATFTLLGGIAQYEDSSRATHTTPIFGGGVKLYPRDRIVIDATGSIQLQQGSDAMDIYHYEVGVRFYITDKLSLRAGYGQLFLGDRNVPTIQVGLGYAF